MPRKVNGFLTSSGQFFNTKDEAETYEIISAVNAAISVFIDTVPVFQLVPRDYIEDQIRGFLIANAAAINRYTDGKHTPAAPVFEQHDIRDTILRPVPTRDRPEGVVDDEATFIDELVRSAAEAEAEHDQRLRDGSLPELDEGGSPDEDLREDTEEEP